jgi:hypothetical protein
MFPLIWPNYLLRRVPRRDCAPQFRHPVAVGAFPEGRIRLRGWRLTGMWVSGTGTRQNLHAVASCLRKKPTRHRFASERIRPEQKTQASRFDLARALAPRYAHASRQEKGQLLDEFCELTGYSRKHALVLLGCPPPEDRPPPYRGRLPSYGPAEVALLRMWSATDGICSKRLAPFLPELLERLRHWHALRHVSAETIKRVAHMSPATIDRALAASRAGRRGSACCISRSRRAPRRTLACPNAA